MIEKLEKILKPTIKEMNLELYDLEYVKEGNDYYLRVYLDKKDGIDLNDIVDASKELSELLDREDPIKDEYFLEVSSPGAEKPLKTREQLMNALDEYIRIEFINPKEGFDFVEGYLLSFEDDVLEVQYLVKNVKKKIEVDYENIKKARLAIKF